MIIGGPDYPVHVNGYLCKKCDFFCNGQKVFSFSANVANFLEMSPSVRKTLKFISNAVISSLRPNIKKVTSQNHGKKNVFPPKSKIKFSVLSGGLAQIAVHVHQQTDPANSFQQTELPDNFFTILEIRCNILTEFLSCEMIQPSSIGD